MNLKEIRELTSHISFSIFGQNLLISASEDMKYGKRIFLQVFYDAPCSKTGKVDRWKGGKHYLSEHMTEDEIVKRAYVAFEAAVKHEIMEGFKFDGVILFNPHVNFRELLKVSHLEVMRDPPVEAVPQNFDF
jgi:hypothetical protein